MKAHIKQPQIFEIQKTLPLSDEESIFTYYYVNAGTEVGLQSGWIVDIYRKREFHFPEKAGLLTFQTLWFPVGEARIVFARKNISVLREHKIYLHDKDQAFFPLKALLIHDRLDIHSLRPLIQPPQNLFPKIVVKDIEMQTEL